MTTDYKNEKINVADLKPGMFVAEPDRPWLDLPFFIQGFVIEDEKQIKTFQDSCDWVIVDRTKSIGSEYKALKIESTPNKSEKVATSFIRIENNAAEAKKQPLGKTEENSKNTFLEILRDLKKYNADSKNQQPALTSQDGNTNRIKITNQGNPESAHSSPQASDDIDQTYAKPDILGTFSKALSWLKRKDKTDSSQDEKQADLEQANATLNGYQISIYQEAEPVEEEIERVFPAYEQAQIATREIFEALSQSQNLDVSHLSDTLDDIADSILRSPDALIWLSKLKKTDSYTYNHSLSVAINLMAFASFISLEKEKIKQLGMAGLLQDVGKAKVPAEILNKTEPLTQEEIDLVRRHVDEGLNILEENKSIPSPVILLVSQHHERIDGSGYPYGLKNKQISLEAQMAGLVDTYCALTTNRPYAKGLFNQQALEEIHKRSGKAFSAHLIDQLVQFLGMYPVSTLVELNTGEVGVVIQQNQVRRLLPRVMILMDSNKEKIPYPTVINLLYSPLNPTGKPYEIVRSLPPDSFGLNPEDFYASTVIAA